MGLFGDQALRLLRETWASPTELAEELYAIFTSTSPVKIDSPVEITNTTSQAPLTLRNFGNTDSAISIESQDPAMPSFPDIPPLPDLNPGERVFTIIFDGGGTGTGSTPPTSPKPQGGGGFPGKVVSGSGSTYQVDVYLEGLSKAPTRRSVTQLQIASDASIPAGTWAIVAQAGSSYVMQVPVWL